MKTYNLSKAEKGKTRYTHSDDLSVLFRNSVENNNIGASNVSDVQVDFEIPNHVDQEQQIPQNLGDAISERLASVIKKQCSYEPEKLAILKNCLKNY